MSNIFYTECEEYFINSLALCDITQHVHNPNHFMFQNSSYSFYTNVERNGGSMLKLMDDYYSYVNSIENDDDDDEYYD